MDDATIPPVLFHHRSPGDACSPARIVFRGTARETRQAKATARGRGATGLAPRAASTSARVLMRKAAAVLRTRRDEFAALMTDEMGKPVNDGRAEVEKCATACEHFAAKAPATWRASDRRSKRRRLRHLQPDRRRPRRDAMELPVLAGVSLRRTGADGRQRRRSQAREQRPGCALAIEAVFREAGFPEHLFGTVLVPSAEVQRADRGSAHRGGHANRQRRRRPQRRRDRRRRC